MKMACGPVLKRRWRVPDDVTMVDHGHCRDESEAPALFDQGSDDVRKLQRGRPEKLMCSLGEIADLSAQGMRVQCQGKCKLLPGQIMQVVIATEHGDISVECAIRWVKKSPFLVYELGVQFAQVTPAQATHLNSLAWGRGLRRVASV